jgi:hypothetical protein
MEYEAHLAALKLWTRRSVLFKCGAAAGGRWLERRGLRLDRVGPSQRDQLSVTVSRWSVRSDEKRVSARGSLLQVFSRGPGSKQLRSSQDQQADALINFITKLDCRGARSR